MRIIGMPNLGSHTNVRITVEHGQDPRLLLWKKGWVLGSLLSAYLDDDGRVVVVARVSERRASSRRPKVKERGWTDEVDPDPNEPIVPYQRVASYAIVRSEAGVLGTQCSDKTAIPGLWQLPGGGLKRGESPSQALIREITEETNQQVKIDRVLDIQSDHWIGRAPNGRLEDFHALRLFYAAICENPSEPRVLDVNGTTSRSVWIPVNRWRSLNWTSASRSIMDRYLRYIAAA